MTNKLSIDYFINFHVLTHEVVANYAVSGAEGYTVLIYIRDILQDRNVYFFDDGYLLDGGVDPQSSCR